MLSAMANTPNWEQRLMAFNNGQGHASYINGQQWVGEASLEGLGPGDGTSAGDQAVQVIGAVGTAATNFITAQQQAKAAAKVAKAKGAVPASHPLAQSGGGSGGGGFFEGEGKWLLVAGVVVIGGILLFSMMGKKKKSDSGEKKGD